MLDETKALLAELQSRVVRTQIDEKVKCERVCSDCLSMRPVQDQRTRVPQALSRTVHVAVPRIKVCCSVDKGPFGDVPFSPALGLLPDRCTLEVRQLEVELDGRHSVREAARLMATFLPCPPPNHASVRNWLHQVAEELDAKDAAPASPSPRDLGIVEVIDGAHICAAPGYQTRHFDVTVGKVVAPRCRSRRFTLALLGAEPSLSHIRAALAAQRWRPQVPVTGISDGEAVLSEPVPSATGSDVTRILDWWHISMRARHTEQTLQGVYALNPAHQAELDIVSYRLSRVRHLSWNGYHDEARRELSGLQHLASEAVYLNEESLCASVTRFIAHCEDLRSYLANNETALIDYASRYRANQPLSTSPAKDCADEIANVRIAKRHRMHWSPRRAPRLAMIRTAVLDGQLYFREPIGKDCVIARVLSVPYPGTRGTHFVGLRGGKNATARNRGRP